MSWLGSILIALLLAVGGTLLGGFLAGRAVRWRRVSQREGYAGYWMVVMAALAGFFSLVAGLLVARYAGIDDGFLAFACAAGVAFGGIGLAGLLAWLSADRAPRNGGQALGFDLEIRTPAGAATIPRNSMEFYGYLSASGAGMEAIAFDFARLAQVEGRWVLPGFVRLITSAPAPYLALGGQRLGGNTVHFSFGPEPLRRDQLGQWGDWLAGAPVGGDPASDGGAFELRLRLRPVPATPA